MARFFTYENITFKRHGASESLVVGGDIVNRSGRNYNSVVFRVVLFVKNTPVGSEVVTINGFLSGQTRSFEKPIGDLEYSKIANSITQCDIYAESAY
ncbi:MAG: hypothetical protein PHT41_06500 [Candidatus Omnitrophica bacterium]|nr:hypothetical protein [Candidatus Omnitrophota bacterium]MDD5237840.1 hypothetical protein [Candidatus Omnitrophota bacterium]